jgi:hypothetical protein
LKVGVRRVACLRMTDDGRWLLDCRLDSAFHVLFLKQPDLGNCSEKPGAGAAARETISTGIPPSQFRPL